MHQVIKKFPFGGWNKVEMWNVQISSVIIRGGQEVGARTESREVSRMAAQLQAVMHQ